MCPFSTLRNFLIGWLVLGGSALPLPAEETVLIDKEGRSLRAELLHYENEVLSLRVLGSGKPYDIPVEKLSVESQERVEAWVKAGGHLSAEFEIDYASGRRGSKVGPDVHKQILKPEVTLTNGKGNQNTTPIKLVTVILGRPVLDKSKVHVLSKEEHKVPSLDPLQSYRIFLKKLEIEYDDENYHRYGQKYYGYALYLMKDGKVIETKYNPKSIQKKYGQTLLNASPQEELAPAF